MARPTNLDTAASSAQDERILASASSNPAIHVSPKLVILIVGVLLVGAIGRYVEARQRERRRAARKERQREYRRYLKSAGWRRRRSTAVARSDGFCEDCGSRSDLDVHHRTYARKGAELPNDLVALCRRCHTARHKGKRTGLDWALLTVLRWWRIRRYRGMSREPA